MVSDQQVRRLRTGPVRTNTFKLFTGIAAVVGCAVLAFALAYPTPTQPSLLSTPRKVSVSFSSGFTAHIVVRDANQEDTCWTVSPSHPKPRLTWWTGSGQRIKIAPESEASSPSVNQ